MGLLETASASLIAGERRLDTIARNITNVSTPGYKREISFSEIAEGAGDTARAQVKSVVDTAQGALVDTRNPLDLAINGRAYLLVRDADTFALSRGGQFSIGVGGTLVDALGRAVQLAGGGDLVLSGSRFEVLKDGTVLEGDVPVGVIGMFEPGAANPAIALGEAALMALSEAEGSELLQGMSEKSNVVMSDEMVRMMSNQRQTEGAAQIVRAYDQLMSQAISTFSRSGS